VLYKVHGKSIVPYVLENIWKIHSSIYMENYTPYIWKIHCSIYMANASPYIWISTYAESKKDINKRLIK